jgi:hypothetical protein
MTIGLDAWRGARVEQRTTIILLTAGAGLGKTRLAEELMARARLDGASTLAVRGVAADRGAPWNGIIGLARGGLLATAGIAAAAPSAHAAFALRVRNGRPLPAAVEWSRQNLGTAFVEVIRRGREQPLVILATTRTWWIGSRCSRWSSCHGTCRTLQC